METSLVTTIFFTAPLIVAVASGITGAVMGRNRRCGSFRAFLWGALLPGVGLLRPLVSRREPQAQDLSCLRNGSSPSETSLRQARENGELRERVRTLEESLRDSEARRESLQRRLDSSRPEAGEKKNVKEPARSEDRKARQEAPRGRGYRR